MVEAIVRRGATATRNGISLNALATRLADAAKRDSAATSRSVHAILAAVATTTVVAI